MGRGQVLSIYRTLIPVCVLFFISVRELTFFSLSASLPLFSYLLGCPGFVVYPFVSGTHVRCGVVWGGIVCIDGTCGTRCGFGYPKSAGGCLESLGGVIQVSIQWFLFNVMYVLSTHTKAQC